MIHAVDASLCCYFTRWKPLVPVHRGWTIRVDQSFRLFPTLYREKLPTLPD